MIKVNVEANAVETGNLVDKSIHSEVRESEITMDFHYVLMRNA